MVAKKLNEPTVQYCVEVSVPQTGEVVDRYTIEQVEAGKGSGGLDHPNYNTVQVHLDGLSKRNGLVYKIVRWGDVKDRSRWMSGGPLGE